MIYSTGFWPLPSHIRSRIARHFFRARLDANLAWFLLMQGTCQYGQNISFIFLCRFLAFCCTSAIMNLWLAITLITLTQGTTLCLLKQRNLPPRPLPSTLPSPTKIGTTTVSALTLCQQKLLRWFLGHLPRAQTNGYVGTKCPPLKSSAARASSRRSTWPLTVRAVGAPSVALSAWARS